MPTGLEGWSPDGRAPPPARRGAHGRGAGLLGAGDSHLGVRRPRQARPRSSTDRGADGGSASGREHPEGRQPHAAPVRRRRGRAVRLDPTALGAGQPGSGQGEGRLRVRPAQDTSRPALGTVVPHEGGPGYSTTGTGEDYAAMYGPLLKRRNLLLVDQRGTGRSEPINCRGLQNLTIAYNVAAAKCANHLGARADDYTTALSADDVAAVITQARPGPRRPVRRLLRHVLHAGLRRPPSVPRAERPARQRVPGVRRVGVVPDPGAGDATRLHRRLPTLACLPRAGRPFLARVATGAQRRPRAPVARRRLRRRRCEGHRVGERAEPDDARVRRDVRPALLPRDDRRDAVGPAR